MAAPTQSRVLKFGVFEADLGAGELRKSGMRQKLAAQHFEVLQLLLEHPQQVVSREELRRHIWPQDTFVDYDLALRKAITRLREVLGDSAESPRFIETIPRRGYRFIALLHTNGSVPTVSDLPTAASPQPTRSGRGLLIRVLLGIGAAIALLVLLDFASAKLKWRKQAVMAAPQIRSLAVLPLRNLSPDPTQEYFSDGLTDELITELAQIGSIRVISHTSTMQYKDAKKSLPEISHELNVDGIVEGTVQRSGDRVRITAQLINGPSDRHIWAKSYERNIGDVFALERDVTQDIARQVQARLTLSNQVAMAQPRPVNQKALEAYLQGNYHLHKGYMGVRDKEFRTAGEYFQQAIDAAPDFTLAYVGVAESHNTLFFPSNEDFGIMKGAAEKAVGLDPASSEARAELAATKSNDWDWAGAEAEFRKAIALNPNNANAHDGLGQLLDATGRLEEGWKEFEVAQELDPRFNHLSDPFYRRGEYDRAIELEQTLEGPWGDFVHHYALSQYYALKGTYKEWVQELSRSFILMGSPESASRIRQAFSVSGYLGARRQEARELERWFATNQDYSPCTLAEIYTAVGEKDRAFYWLAQGIEHHRLAMNDDLNWFKVVPELAPLHSDPRFKELLLRAGLPP
jgi:TolB-like protein/DNA-binding winged helix-turn-helix (wHTH) protein